MVTKSKEHCLVNIEAKRTKANIKSNQVEVKHTETYFNVRLLNLSCILKGIERLMSLFNL